MKLLFDLLAPPALLFFAWSGARSWPSSHEHVSAFLGSALLGTLAGFRLAWSAFRWGRRRKGRDPEPAPAAPDDIVKPMLRFIGCSFGAVVCGIAGFICWALAATFFHSLQP